MRLTAGVTSTDRLTSAEALSVLARPGLSKEGVKVSRLTYILRVSFDKYNLTPNEFEAYLNDIEDNLILELNLQASEWHHANIKYKVAVDFHLNAVNRTLTHERIDQALLSAHKKAMEGLEIPREKLQLRLVD